MIKDIGLSAQNILGVGEPLRCRIDIEDVVVFTLISNRLSYYHVLAFPESLCSLVSSTDMGE